MAKLALFAILALLAAYTRGGAAILGGLLPGSGSKCSAVGDTCCGLLGTSILANCQGTNLICDAATNKCKTLSSTSSSCGLLGLGCCASDTCTSGRVPLFSCASL